MSDSLKRGLEPFVAIPKDILEVTTDKSAFMLYFALKWHTNGATGETFPSYSRLQNMTGMGRNTIAKALKHLIEVGLISVKKDDSKPSNQYILHWDSIQSDTSCETKLVSEQNSASFETKPSLVSKQNSNKNKLTRKSNEIKIDIGAKLKSDVNFQKEWLKEKLQAHTDKYTRQELNEFYLYWVSPCDINGKTNLTDALKGKKSTFNVGQRLANARKRGFLTSKQNNSNYNRPQTFQEIEAENFKKVMNAPNPFTLQGVENEQID